MWSWSKVQYICMYAKKQYCQAPGPGLDLANLVLDLDNLVLDLANLVTNLDKPSLG